MWARYKFSEHRLWYSTGNVLRYVPRIFIWVGLLFGLSLGIATLVVFVDYVSYRPQIKDALLKEKERLQSGSGVPGTLIHVYDTDNRLLGSINAYNASNLSLQQCAQMEWLNKAAIASEDRSFYGHFGVSIRGILRAMKNNILSYSLREGGGSITQQLARNLFTSGKKNISRKIFETFAAFQIESHLSKDEILCSYLNEIYMGEGQMGAQQASWFYFNKPPQALSAAEAAMLVGLFPSPSYYSPLRDLGVSRIRQQKVLSDLMELEELSKEESEKSVAQFEEDFAMQENDPGNLGDHASNNNFRKNYAPTVNDYVHNFVLQNFAAKDLERNRIMRVYTSIRYKKQKMVEAIVAQAIDEERKRTGNAYVSASKRKNKDWQSVTKKIQGVFIAIDAKTSEITAIVGGRSPLEGGLATRPWLMLRQPGSSIKGFLYAVALDEDIYRAKSLVYDEPVKYGSYEPKNWNNQYLGTIPLAMAVAGSVNTVAVKTLEQIGVGYFRQKMGRAIGLSRVEARRRFPNNLSLALGSGELTPLELGQMYLALLNKGRAQKPQMIRTIENERSEVIYTAPVQYARRILREDSTSEALWLLSQVFSRRLGGTAAFVEKIRERRPDFLDFPIAGKTGSVQMTAKNIRDFGIRGYRDAWFVGLHPTEVNVVWFGHDQGAPIRGSGTQAAVVWSRVAQATLGPTKAKFTDSRDWPKLGELDWFFNRDTTNSAPDASGALDKRDDSDSAITEGLQDTNDKKKKKKKKKGSQSNLDKRVEQVEEENTIWDFSDLQSPDLEEAEDPNIERFPSEL